MNDIDLSSPVIVAVIGLLSCGAAMVGWSYDEFQTKSEAQGIEKRLDRIEAKLDKLVDSL